MDNILNQKTRSFFDEVDLFKQMENTFTAFENQSPTKYENKNWGLEKNINNTFGKNSIFYNYHDISSNSNNAENILNTQDSFIFNIIVCESGTEVFEKYNSATEYQPTTKQIYIFIEKKDNKKNNLFGTACRVKMGNEREALMQELLDGNTNISVEDEIHSAKNLKQWAENISRYSKGTKTEIDADVLINAVKLELVNKSDFNKILETIFGLNNKLADWMNSGVEAMEEWKFTEENYEYQKFYQKDNFKPIIPIKIPDTSYGNNIKSITATGISSLLTLADKFDEIAMGIIHNVVKATPNIVDDFLYAVIFYLKNYLENYVLGRFKEIFDKIKELINLAVNFLKDIAAKTVDFLSEQLALLNAFLCGLVNGIISLFQTIIVVLAFVVDNISILELENATKTEISKHQEKLEFVEDLIDLVSENAAALFSGLVTMFTTTKILTETISFINDIWKKSVNSIQNTSKYFWAYFIGAVAFELILDAVIAFFTGGASVVAKTAAKVSAKITRLATKVEDLASKGIKLGNQLGKKVAENASGLYKWLKNEFLELLEAIKNGNFVNYIKEKIRFLCDSKDIDEVLNADYLSKWDDLPVSGKGYLGGKVLNRREVQEWMRKIKSLSKGESMLVILPKGHKLLQGNRAGFNPFNGNIYVQKGMTEYEIFHESKHLEEFMKIGKDEYIRGMKDIGFSPEQDFIRTYKREKYVFDEIIKNKNKFNTTELKDAERYINKTIQDCIDAGIDITKIK